MKARTLSIALASVAAAALIATGVVANGQVVGANMVATQVKAADRAEDFRLVDQNSKSHLLSYYKFASSVVIISHVNGSSLLNDAVPQIKALQASLKQSGGQLFFLNSTPGVQREAIIADMAGLGLDIPVLIDDTQLIGESLGVSRVGQALVISPKTWKVAYSGPIAANLAGKALR